MILKWDMQLKMKIIGNKHVKSYGLKAIVESVISLLSSIPLVTTIILIIMTDGILSVRIVGIILNQVINTVQPIMAAFGLCLERKPNLIIVQFLFLGFTLLTGKHKLSLLLIRYLLK